MTEDTDKGASRGGQPGGQSGARQGTDKGVRAVIQTPQTAAAAPYNSPVSRSRLVVSCLFLALPLALVLTEIRLYSANTLAGNGRWVSAKPLMQVPLMGARQYLVTRNALAGNRLDLGAWHGYNEVYLHSPVTVGTLELSFRLEPDAHLSVLLGRTESGFDGLRLSRHTHFPSRIFRGERSGRFSAVSPVEHQTLTDGWHTLRIEAGDTAWTASLDDQVIATSSRPLPAGLIGFRNGFSRVEIDDVRLTGPSGELVLDEHFRNGRNRAPILLIALAASFALLMSVALLTGRGNPTDRRAPTQWAALVAIVATIAALLFLAFDHLVWSRSYIYQERNPNAPEPPALLVALESARQTLFGAPSVETLDLPVDEVARRITAWDLEDEFAWPGPNRYNRYPAFTSAAPGEPRYVPYPALERFERQGDEHVLAFVGSSQTVGVGAEVVGQAMVSRTHDALVARRSESSPPLWIFNLAIAGGRAPDLVRYYERTWIDLEPDTVVVNLSFNDRDVPRFEESLRRLIELNRSREIGTVLVVEALSADKDDPGVRERQAMVREVGRTTGTPVIDLEAGLAAPEVYDSGLLWWDQVHMTSYAQALAGQILARGLTEAIQYEAMQSEPRQRP